MSVDLAEFLESLAWWPKLNLLCSTGINAGIGRSQKVTAIFRLAFRGNTHGFGEGIRAVCTNAIALLAAGKGCE